MRSGLAILLATLLLSAATPARAQKKPKPAPAAQARPAPAPTAPAAKKKARTFDFGAMSFEGSLRTPQLLYFLNRVKQELDRASLEKRSFIPELVRSVDEGGL